MHDVHRTSWPFGKALRFDAETAVEAGPEILPRDHRRQFHHLPGIQVLSQAAKQLLRNVRRRTCQGDSIPWTRFSSSENAELVSNSIRSPSCSSLMPSPLPTAELRSIQNGQPTSMAVCKLASSLRRTFNDRAASTPPSICPMARNSRGWCAATVTGSRSRSFPVSLLIFRRTNQKTILVSNPAFADQRRSSRP